MIKIKIYEEGVLTTDLKECLHEPQEGVDFVLYGVIPYLMEFIFFDSTI